MREFERLGGDDYDVDLCAKWVARGLSKKASMCLARGRLQSDDEAMGAVGDLWKIFACGKNTIDEIKVYLRLETMY